MKGRIALVVALIALLFVPQTAQADNVWDMAKSDEYGRKAGGMLGRGFLNVGSCFVDLIVQTVEKTQQGPPVVGTLTGIGGGAACTILRAGSGIVDVATFWIPDFNGVPVSRSYSNCIETDEVPSQTMPAYQSQAMPSYDTGPVVAAPAAQDTMKYVDKSGARSSGSQDPMKYVKK